MHIELLQPSLLTNMLTQLHTYIPMQDYIYTCNTALTLGSFILAIDPAIHDIIKNILSPGVLVLRIYNIGNTLNIQENPINTH